jgi:hypothetical protein
MSRLSAILLCSLGVLALVLTLSGCGEGKAASESANAPSEGVRVPSGNTRAKVGLVAQADRICGRLNAELQSIKPKSKTQQEVLRIVLLSVRAERRALRELSRLHPPASLIHDWRDMLGDRRALADQLSQYGRLIKQSDKAAIPALGASKRRLHNALRKTAKRSGFHDCTKVGV